MPALIVRLAATALLSLPAASMTFPDQTGMLAEVNRLRGGPAAYAAGLERFATGYHGLEYTDDAGVLNASVEGAPAVRGAALAVAAATPLPPLSPDPILQAAAREHVERQGPTGEVGHLSAAGESPGDRVRRHGGDVFVGEVIAYGPGDAADVVRQLVVDDGVPDRGHRHLLLSRAYRYAGGWCGPHADYGTMCVIDLASAPAGRPQLPGSGRQG